MARHPNFNAGPSALPYEVLEQVRDTVVEHRGLGLSLLEASHRSGEYEEVHDGAIALIRELLSVPPEFKILFLGGGATLQFAMVPMNLLGTGTCDFVVSGSWAQKALEDAQKLGKVSVLFDGSAGGFSELPASVACTSGAAYLHLTSNETIDGLQWKQFPSVGAVPVVVDASSDIMSKALPFDRLALVYAGAQKNLGPAGVTVVIIRDDLLKTCASGLPEYLSYRTHADKNSLYNTPPVFAISILKLVLDWVKKQGGVPAMARLAAEKSRLLYDRIDGSGGFYTCKVAKPFRSEMNVVFRLKTEELEGRFLKQASQAGMIGLKGHRSVGGCRASLYNAVELAWARQLADLMDEFRKKNG